MENSKKEDESIVQQYETSSKSSVTNRCCSSLKRFWWLYLLITVLGALLIVLLVIFVGVKNIAQSKMNNAKLSVQGISVLSTTDSSFVISINSTIEGDGSIKATIEPFDGEMYLEDEPGHTPFANVRFPQTKNIKVQPVNVTQTIPIDNVTALTEFNTWLLNNDTVRVTIKGNTHVKVPGISHRYPVHFKKTITLDGLSMFSGLSVENSSVTISNFSDGTNFHTTAVIPNRSIVTFDIGNVTFNTFINGSSAGDAWLENVTLYPGNNTFPFRANITQSLVLSAMESYPGCSDGIVDVDISGREVTNNGESLSYFADALASANETIPVDLGTPFRAIGLNFTCSS